MLFLAPPKSSVNSQDNGPPCCSSAFNKDMTMCKAERSLFRMPPKLKPSLKQSRLGVWLRVFEHPQSAVVVLLQS